MRQEQFNQYVNLLQTDPYFGVSVYDLTNGIKKILLNKSKSEIEEKFGSVENFFNGLVDSGVKKIQIIPLQTNGKNNGRTTWIKNKKHDFIEVSLVPTNEVTPTVQPFQTSAPVHYSAPQLNGFPGMNLPQLIDLHADSRDKVRLEERNKALESENERLKEQIYEFKDKELKWNNSNAKSEQNATLIQAIIANADKLPTVISAFKGGSAPVAEAVVNGLGNPNYSPTKNALLQDIANADDFTVQILDRVFSKFSDDNFVDKLNALLK